MRSSLEDVVATVQSRQNGNVDIHTKPNGRHDRHTKRRRNRRQRYTPWGRSWAGARGEPRPVLTGKGVDAQVRYQSVGRRAAIAALAIKRAPNGRPTVRDLTHAAVARLWDVSHSSLAQALRRNEAELVAIAHNWRPLELPEDRLRHEIRMAGIEPSLDVLAEVEEEAADPEEIF